MVPDGSLVLVCDLGESWTTALVHLDGLNPVQLAQETAPAGRDLEAMLLDDLRAQAGDWLEPRLAVPGPAGAAARQEAMDLLRRMRRALDEAPEVTERLGEDGPHLHAEPGLARAGWPSPACAGPWRAAAA